MHLWYACITNFTAKMLQVIYLVIRCEAKFSKVRLKIFKCTEVKCLLGTKLASSVKPSTQPKTANWICITRFQLALFARDPPNREGIKYFDHYFAITIFSPNPTFVPSLIRLRLVI